MKTVLVGADLVDGSGAPRRQADVVVDGATILDVVDRDPRAGDSAYSADLRRVDLTGLVLAPGFIDIHTHYDAQVTWDQDLTPSSWNGVTTVVMGNCGFGIAPTRVDHRDVIIRTLENVEGMSAAALRSGIDWGFESFPDYMQWLDRTPLRLNVGAFIGHTPVRQFVLGDAASVRPADDGETSAMVDLIDEGLDAGALGFATSRTTLHMGADGRPVPSMLADESEVLALSRRVRHRRAVVQMTAKPSAQGVGPRALAQMAADIGGRLIWTALLTGQDGPGQAVAQMEETGRLGGGVWPQTSCKPMVAQINLADPAAFAGLPSFGGIFALPRPERRALYGEKAWREAARPEVRAYLGHRWDCVTVQESVAHPQLVDGHGLGTLALEQGYDDPFDLLLDLSMEEDLSTRFRMVLANDDTEELAALLSDARCIIGLSDAGAHASQLCDADFAPYLLSTWVRERGVLSLEEAVWRLTGQPADVFGIPKRGYVKPGFAADLVAFDPARIRPGPQERVRDLPGDADRLVSRCEGVEWVWINGTATHAKGEAIPAVYPGAVVRPD